MFRLQDEAVVVTLLSAALDLPVDDLRASLDTYRRSAGGYVQMGRDGKPGIWASPAVHERWANDYVSAVVTHPWGDNGVRKVLAGTWGTTLYAVERRIRTLRQRGLLPQYHGPVRWDLCGAGQHQMQGRNVMERYRPDRGTWERSCRACMNMHAREYQRRKRTAANNTS